MQFIAGVGLDVVLEDLRRLRPGEVGSAGPAAGPHRGIEPDRRPVGGRTSHRSLLTGRFDADGAARRWVHDRALRRRGSRVVPPSATAPAAGVDSSAIACPAPGRTRGVVRSRPPVLPQRRPHRRPGRRGAGVRQPPGHPPPRRQAVEPAAGQPRQRLGRRLRPGQDHRGRRPDAYRRHPRARSATWLPSGSRASATRGRTSTAWA